MAKTEEIPMVRMVHVETGQPVSVAADKVGRMPAVWELEDGTDPREKAKAGAVKADRQRAAAREKAAKAAAAEAEKAAATDAPSADTADTTGADGAN